MKHALYDHHKEHADSLGIENVPAHLDIPQDEYDAIFASWKKTLPDADEATLHTKTLGHFAWKNHSTVKEIVPEIITRGTEFADAVTLAKKFGWAVIGLLFVLILATLFAPKAHGQFSHINSITASNNDNSQQGFFASPFTFKAGANCSFSVSGSVATFNCSGGAAGAGGSNTQVQWNSTGSLAGISTLTTDGTIVTQKVGTNLLFADPTDATKKIQFDASGVSSATTRTVAFPDANSRTIKNGTTTGQIPIWNAGTSTFDVSDPLVQGTTAEGAAIPNPVVIAGKDGSGNNKALVLDSSGRPTVNVNGTVAVSLASAPTTAVTVADAADVTLGAKADAKSTATDTTAISIMQVLKEISAMEQAPASRAVTNAGTFAVQDATLDGAVTSSKFQINNAQVSGTAIDTNSGNKSAGTQRMVQATDQPALPAAGQGATGSAPPTGATQAGGLCSGATGGLLCGIPVADTPKAINISTATTTLIVTGVSGRQVRISSWDLMAAGADNVAWIEGTGATCGTGTAGMAGGTTAASGYNFAANGGMAKGSGLGTVLQTVTAGDSVCLVTSANVQLSGSLMYAIY